MRAYAASWVITGLPGDAPLRDGAVVLDDGARIVAVGRASELRAQYSAASWSDEHAILLPGLVNAHVHLELSKLRGETRSGGGFGPWVSSLMERRAALLPEQDADAIDGGISELLRSGTAAVGEVSNTLASVELLGSAPILGRVFHEVFGLQREAAAAMLTQAKRTRGQIATWPRNLSYALAPHTVYSLHPETLREVVHGALARGERTSLHLSEHSAERAFLRDGTGPFADFLALRGAPLGDFSAPGSSPVAYAAELGVLGSHVIAIHLCDTLPAELQRVRELGCQAVLCPRSNLFIELKLPPLLDILRAGLLPGLGTDSLASNTTLDVLAEAAALRDRFPQVEPGLLISMATWYGAQALGLSHRVGALKPGLSPGLLAFDLERPVDDPLSYVLRAPPRPRRVLARPAMPSSSQTLEDNP
ncbi:MAG: Adenosine deaminase [Myxococcaceae bacterium]|nr:Adenosine deaminase [Myxococcaceae bacterium]